MSTAKLDVWVTAVGEPCKIDMKYQWYVHVLHCNGEILDWCGRRFVNLVTKCGHLEIEIPPGCYSVCATWSPAPAGGAVPTSLGNHISHMVIVRANCGDHLCVTLFPPTFHWCSIWWLIAAQDLMKNKLLPQDAREITQKTIESMEELQRVLPKDEFTERMMKIRKEKLPAPSKRG